MALGLIESYNRTRYSEELLEKIEHQPPSFTVHLHPEYWVLNNGSKFLYHNQIASLLDDIRAHRIPVDFLDLFDAKRVPFYEGCMVVELLDYRAPKASLPQPEKPEKTRVILHPNPETLYADICSMNQRNGGKWTDKEAVEVEAKLLLATTPPLCLDPNPHLTRIANHVLRASTPTVPTSLKRKAAAIEFEESEAEKIRKKQIISFSAPRQTNRKPAPSYTILDALTKARTDQAAEDLNPRPSFMHHPYLLGPPPRPPVRPPTQIQSPIKTSTTPVPPQPPQPTHQFIPQQPPAAVPATPAMQPRVYATVQASTDAAASAAPQCTPHPHARVAIPRRWCARCTQPSATTSTGTSASPTPAPNAAEGTAAETDLIRLAAGALGAPDPTALAEHVSREREHAAAAAPAPSEHPDAQPQHRTPPAEIHVDGAHTRSYGGYGASLSGTAVYHASWARTAANPLCTRQRRSCRRSGPTSTTSTGPSSSTSTSTSAPTTTTRAIPIPIPPSPSPSAPTTPSASHPSPTNPSPISPSAPSRRCATATHAANPTTAPSRRLPAAQRAHGGDPEPAEPAAAGPGAECGEEEDPACDGEGYCGESVSWGGGEDGADESAGGGGYGTGECECEYGPGEWGGECGGGGEGWDACECECECECGWVAGGVGCGWECGSCECERERSHALPRARQPRHRRAAARRVVLNSPAAAAAAWAWTVYVCGWV
ncbi:Spt20 family-domain-containing protein [Ephemerocybe angulata]|uniref:Spt20 family-domain-containing protein n=1 Tax=Ephemerocybe angulata TaxID=980116 RepID=A0A8H6M6H7_9AGAR|nr:Spt20 family-domain-containing protein [Tulosesus angulatus]